MRDISERYGNEDGKPQLSYNIIGAECNDGEARVWSLNDKVNGGKYPRGNWVLGSQWTQCVDSVMRHLQAIANGAYIDTETKLPHVDHLVCAAKILSQAWHTRKDLDNIS